MGAGIVPVAEYKGTIYFLFGQEYYDKTWGDFGGKPNNSEAVFENAIREGYEELDGFFGTKIELKQMVKFNFIKRLNSLDDTYHSYLFKTYYNPDLPMYFNNHHKFIQDNFPNEVDKNGYFEKSQMRWFTKNDLINEKLQFRYFYKDIIQQIINNYDIIYKKIKRIK